MQKQKTGHPLWSILLAIITLLVIPAAVAADRGIAYISNQNGAVSTIDLGTMEIKDNINIGAKGPRGIGVTDDGKWLITANKDDNNVSITDTTGTNPPKLVTIGKNPEFVRILGNRAYVTYEPGSSGGPIKKTADAKDDDDDDNIPGHIAIVDILKGKVILDIVGKPETEGLEFSKDGKKLIVTNESDNSITVHDLNSGKLIKSISLGKYGERPRGIKLSPDGKIFLVTLELSDKLLVLNDKFRVIKEIPTGKAPYGVSFDASGQHIFVAANKEKMLQVFDTKNFKKIKDIPSGDRCWHFTFTPDNQQLLLACGKSSEIIVIDAQKLEVTKRITDKDMPWGILTYPKGMGSLDQP